MPNGNTNKLTVSTFLTAGVMFAAIVTGYVTLKTEYHNHAEQSDVHMPFSEKIDTFVTRNQYIGQQSAHEDEFSVIDAKVDRMLIEQNTMQSDIRHIRDLLEDRP